MKSYKMQCEYCKEIIFKKTPHQRRCLACSNKHRKPSKVEMPKEYEKECPVCKKIFKTNHHSQKFCAPNCRQRDHNMKLNEKWIKSVPRKQDIYANDRIEYSRVSKKPMFWMKKFNACRG